MTTETAEPVITDDIREAARAMYAQFGDAAWLEKHSRGIYGLRNLMACRNVLRLVNVQWNSPEHRSFSADKNYEYISGIDHDYVFAECEPAAAAPVAAPADTKTIIRELYNPDMAYAVGDVVDGKTIVAIKTTGVDEDNDDFYPTQYCTVRPATEGEIAASNAAQQQRKDEINERAARDSARYAGYEF